MRVQFPSDGDIAVSIKTSHELVALISEVALRREICRIFPSAILVRSIRCWRDLGGRLGDAYFSPRLASSCKPVPERSSEGIELLRDARFFAPRKPSL